MERFPECTYEYGGTLKVLRFDLHVLLSIRNAILLVKCPKDFFNSGVTTLLKVGTERIF